MDNLDLETYRGRSDMTTREIAQLAGCSHSTVSRVFRNISVTETPAVERVRKILEVTGYRPNPMVRSLMQSQGARRSTKEILTNIGWLNCHRNPNYWTGVYPWANETYAGARERAKKLGFGFEQIWASEPGMTNERLLQIIKARGVQGLILSNSAATLDEMKFDHSKHPVVAIGDYFQGHREWDRVGVFSAENVQLAFRELHALGYRRIVLAIGLRLGPKRKGLLSSLNDGRYIHAPDVVLGRFRDLLGGYCYVRQLSESQHQLEPLFYDRNRENDFRQVIESNIRRLGPDAVICADREVLGVIQDIGLNCPKDIGLVHLGLSSDVPDWSGIKTDQREMAAAAVDILAGQIMSNERGIPRNAKHVQLKGKWVAGETTRVVSG